MDTIYNGKKLMYAVQCVNTETFDWNTVAKFCAAGDAMLFAKTLGDRLAETRQEQQLRVTKNGKAISAVYSTP